MVTSKESISSGSQGTLLVPHGGREIRCAHTTAAEPGGCLPDDSEASKKGAGIHTNCGASRVNSVLRLCLEIGFGVTAVAVPFIRQPLPPRPPSCASRRTAFAWSWPAWVRKTEAGVFRTLDCTVWLFRPRIGDRVEEKRKKQSSHPKREPFIRNGRHRD